MDGVEAVLLPEQLRGHVAGGGAAHAGGDQLDRSLFRHQLQGVLIPGDNDRLPAGLTVQGGDGPQQVVRLPAVQLVQGDIHCPQHVLQQGHLAGQLLRHFLALGLVGREGQVPEGGGRPVEGDAQRVGLILGEQLVEDVQKAEDGVGGLARLGGQRLADPVKGPVEDGVSVQDHQFHRNAPLTVHSFLIWVRFVRRNARNSSRWLSLSWSLNTSIKSCPAVYRA